MSATIVTNLGSLYVRLLTDQAPKSSLNFLKLSKMRNFEFCLFHRIEKNFIAQTGDPTASGKGGQSVFNLLDANEPRFFPDELCDPVKLASGLHQSLSKKGVLGMANNGKDKNASQFFVTLADGLDYLDDTYTAFGVLEGEDSFKTLELINGVLCDGKFKPLQKVWIKSVAILEDPFEDPDELLVPAAVEPSEAFTSFLGVDAAEAIELKSSVRVEELEQRRRREEAQARALTLEMIGDLPSADVKPPENVLFVCKLNPLTEDEDLKQVFSRFGPIASCQIIRDKETGNSLGYAFIEYEGAASCEEAYFKMDKVLLDDRRIHVDFSQSVSRLHGLWSKARRRQLRSESGGAGALRGGLELKEEFREREESAHEMLFDPRDVEAAYSHRRANDRESSRRDSGRDHHRDRSPYDYRRRDRSQDDRRGDRSHDDHRDRNPDGNRNGFNRSPQRERQYDRYRR